MASTEKEKGEQGEVFVKSVAVNIHLKFEMLLVVTSSSWNRCETKRYPVTDGGLASRLTGLTSRKS